MVIAQSLAILPSGYKRDGYVQRENRSDLYFRLNVARNQEPELLSQPEFAQNPFQGNGHGSNGKVPENSGALATKAIDIHRAPDGLAYLPLGGHSLAELERETIQQTLNMNKGNRKRSASILGISVRTLQRKIKEWNME